MMKYLFILFALISCNSNKNDVQITDDDVALKDSIPLISSLTIFETPDESAFNGLKLLKGKWNAFKYHGSFCGLKDGKVYSGASMAYKFRSDTTLGYSMFDFDSKGRIFSEFQITHIPIKKGISLIGGDDNFSSLYHVIDDDGCASKCTYCIDEKSKMPSFVKVIAYDTVKQEVWFRFRANLRRLHPEHSTDYPDHLVIEDGAARARVYSCCPVEGF